MSYTDYKESFFKLPDISTRDTIWKETIYNMVIEKYRNNLNKNNDNLNNFLEFSTKYVEELIKRINRRVAKGNRTTKSNSPVPAQKTSSTPTPASVPVPSQKTSSTPAPVPVPAPKTSSISTPAPAPTPAQKQHLPPNILLQLEIIFLNYLI